jgi:hypothetical protein
LFLMRTWRSWTKICYHGHVARIVIVGGGLTPVDAFNLSWNCKPKRLLVFLGSCSVVL